MNISKVEFYEMKTLIKDQRERISEMKSEGIRLERKHREYKKVLAEILKESTDQCDYGSMKAKRVIALIQDALFRLVENENLY